MNDDAPVGFLLGVLVSMAVFVIVALANGLRSQHSFEREAVQHGAATWTVDEDGNRVFQWREAK